MERVIFTVPTIHCEGCAGSIQRALAPVPGVEAVEGDPQTKEVAIIRREGVVSDDELAGRIVGAGHVVARLRYEQGEAHR